MPSDVLIATPSGPFGELIRLTLEADPDFQCTLVDNGSEIWPALSSRDFQVIIFDCSFFEPEPRQVFLRIKDDHPSVALILVPPENRSDINPLKEIRADGFIPRPFDASVLPEQVKAIMEKKNNQPMQIEPSTPISKHDSWWNAFQDGIHETAASSGMIVQNGLVIACTPETSTALQQQVTASVARFWSPEDSTDLMRYVKDLVTGQEWMMYASQTVENAVLVLLFLPQTPVTRVRSQTLKLAKDIAAFMEKPAVEPQKTTPGYLETSEPPRLHDILGEAPAEETPRIIKNHFPVEWFKEADLPEFNTPSQPTPENADKLEESIPEEPSSLEELNELINKVTLAQQNSGFSPANPEEEVVQAAPRMDVPAEEETFETQSEEKLTLPEDNFDLGAFQPVSLLSTKDDMLSHEPIQPVAPESAGDNPTPVEAIENVVIQSTSESYSSSNPTTPAEITQPFEHYVPEPEALAEIQPDEFPPVEKERLSLESFPVEPVQEREIEPEPGRSTIDSGAEEVDFSVNIPPIDSSVDSPLSLDEPGEIKDIDTVADTGLENAAEVKPSTSPLLDRFNLSTAPEESVSDEVTDQQGEAVSASPAGEDLFTRMNQLESAAGNEAHETYTVALIPRTESMILQRQIAGILNQTMSRLCLAFNWSLDNLTIRPTYMQWTITIPVSLAPDDMISIVKKETSQELIKALSADFALADREDFWAPESMSAAGKDFIPSTQWQNFILRRKSHEIA